MNISNNSNARRAVTAVITPQFHLTGHHAQLPLEVPWRKRRNRREINPIVGQLVRAGKM